MTGLVARKSRGLTATNYRAKSNLMNAKTHDASRKSVPAEGEVQEDVNNVNIFDGSSCAQDP